MNRRALFFSSLCLLAAFVLPLAADAANAVTVDASKLVAHVEMSFSPRAGSFVEGSTFEVPIILNTNGASINGIEARINFDPSRLAIVSASSGQSIIGVWVEPPVYDNNKGTASYVGVVPNGIVTKSGVIGTITFRAIGTGQATVLVRADSNILLNDGLGSSANLDRGRAQYSIIPKAPDGVTVYSPTHPLSDSWYNNNSPVVSWEGEQGITGYSYVLDAFPSTIPENTITGTATTKGFEKVQDGLWYFHIKAFKNGVWGGTSHFLIRVDTTPPAKFTPKADYVLAAVALVDRALVSFFTTDNLSGIDHYEVGVIDKSQPPTASPVFVDAESPFQAPPGSPAGLKVIVRAIDKAGNVRDESIDVRAPVLFAQFISDYGLWIVIAVLLLILLGLGIQYLYGHHIIANVKRAWAIVRRESAREEMKEAEQAARAAEKAQPPAPAKDTETPLGGS